MKTAVFRADASILIGSGHVMRCLTLADELKKHSIECHFICRDLPGQMGEMIQHRGYSLTLLPKMQQKFEPTIDDPLHANWLTVPWDKDVEDTTKAMGDIKANWLIIDNYGIDYRWHEMLREYTEKIMVIDDLADRQLECDILLNLNFIPDIEEVYTNLVPKDAKLLLGEKYMLLRPEFNEARKKLKPRDGKVRRILVFYNSFDRTNETGKALEAYLNLKHSDIHMDIVIGSASPNKKTIEKQVKRLPNVKLHFNLPHLADLMTKADLSIGAGGITMWERMFLGLPSLVTTIADNQIACTTNLSKNDYLYYLGHYNQVSTDDILSGTLFFLRDQNMYLDVSKKILDFTNDFSTSNVVKMMLC